MHWYAINIVTVDNNNVPVGKPLLINTVIVGMSDHMVNGSNTNVNTVPADEPVTQLLCSITVLSSQAIATYLVLL